jgi:hypothetical protein
MNQCGGIEVDSEFASIVSLFFLTHKINFSTLFTNKTAKSYQLNYTFFDKKAKFYLLNDIPFLKKQTLIDQKHHGPISQ